MPGGKTNAHRDRGSRRALRPLLGLVALLVATLWGPTAVAQGHASSQLILAPRSAAPDAPGAPFIAATLRTNLVLERLDLRLQLDGLRSADGALRVRNAVDASQTPQSGVEGTIRILESQIAAVEQRLASNEAASVFLLTETQPFNIGIAAFPVASLRKPFFNDWAQPRSGGRRHQGTDLLAHTGIELRSIEDGVVEQIKNGSLGGLSVYLVGDSGARYYYAHLDSAEPLADGERVYAGQRIGTVGDSGNATGSPHLHIQWAPGGGSDWQNPFPLLDVLFGEGAAAEALAAIDEVPSTSTPFGPLSAGR